jgi:phosphoglycerate dehydrogenase-like enzyme
MPPRPRVVVLAPAALFRSFFDAPRERRLSRAFDWRRVAGSSVTPAVRRALRGAEALVTTWDSPRFGEELVSLAPRLRLVAHCGGEVKGRFARALFERLVIANAPGPMAGRVAELAVTFVLMAARRVDDYREALRRPSNAVYVRVHRDGAGPETLRGRTLGILGFGRIGRETARLLGPFGPRLLVHDPYLASSAVRAAGGEPASLARLLRESEYLVIAAGLTDETRGLLDRAALQRLPDGATVVNVARGGIVDLRALTAEVRSGRLRCALDVTDPLEPLPLRHPLRRMRGAILTPHAGAASVEVRRAMADLVLDALERFFRGERVKTRVVPRMLERMT